MLRRRGVGQPLVEEWAETRITPASGVPEEAEASCGACSGPARPGPYRHKWINLSILVAAALAATALGALHLADQRRSRTTFCNVQLHPSPPRGRRERVYAFTDPSIERLEKVRRELAGRGYRLVDCSYGTCPDSSPR